MKPMDIIIVVLAVIAVVGVTVWRIIRKKQGKSCCEYSCGKDCGNCTACPSAKKKNAENNQ